MITLQACYRAARAAYNLKLYNKAVVLAWQGIAKDGNAKELKRIQEVAFFTMGFATELLTVSNVVASLLAATCRSHRSSYKLKSSKLLSVQQEKKLSVGLHSNWQPPLSA